MGMISIKTAENHSIEILSRKRLTKKEVGREKRRTNRAGILDNGNYGGGERMVLLDPFARIKLGNYVKNAEREKERERQKRLERMGEKQEYVL